MLTTCSGGRSRQVPRACIYKYPVIGLNIGILIQSAPQIFGEVMGELFRLLAAGVLGRSYPTIYDLAEGPQALADLEARVSVGKLALRP